MFNPISIYKNVQALLEEVFIVVRHVTTCRQVEVIFIGPMPACSGIFLLTPAGMGW